MIVFIQWSQKWYQVKCYLSYPHLLSLLAFKTTTLWCFWYWLFHASVAVSQYLILPCFAQFWALYIPAGKAITNSFSSWFSSRKAKLVVATSRRLFIKKNYLKSLLLLSTSCMKLKYRKKSMLNYEEFKNSFLICRCSLKKPQNYNK